ncbi:MAG: 50S ribosomal protein L15 [Bacilli bacterium]|nr:50S ribosomal protein L15 [Bacilli bacterium]
MRLNELEKNVGATQRRKIVGRGRGSGLGKTSGKGHKGQNARSGGGVRPVFEGGQTPLYRRLPKRGFSNYEFKTTYAVINVSDLNRFDNGTVVSPALLKEVGLVKNQLDGIKVLGNGKLEKKLTVQAHKFSKTAQEKIEKSGSKIEVM